MKPFLSVVIPAYNEAARLAITLQDTMEFYNHQNYSFEVTVVDDGSVDHTAQIVQEAIQKHPDLNLLRVSHGGKGHACRNGVLASRGEWVFLCDSDLSMPIAEFTKFSALFAHTTPILIASRETPGARRIGEPEYRHVMGRVFNTLVRWLAVAGLQDTQCGFKCFRADVAHQLFRAQTIPGWGFDVEILFIARKWGYTIQEVPIDWYYRGQSKVKPVQDTFNMVRELLKIRLNDLHGMYNQP